MRQPLTNVLAAGLCLWVLATPSTLAQRTALPDPATLEMLRFPVKDAAEVPTQQAYADWPPEQLRQRPYWLPWTWQAFQRAGLFQRPVLFVMTVNWSQPVRRVLSGPLSDSGILEQINESYVSVLVNADRRPDLKERYYTGDWPVIAFLTPDGNPMLSQANDMGVARPITTSQVDTRTMQFLLVEGDKYWKKWPRLLFDVGREWARRAAAIEGTPGVPDELSSDQLAAWLEGNADQTDGGFGAAPKFIVRGFTPYAHIRSARLKNELLPHSRRTLEQLVASPLFDAREGGIHRLAAAPGWGAIQYEKRLTGNTELLNQLLFELRREPSGTLRKALEQTANFVVDVLGRDAGGFHNAQAADPSSPDGSAYWLRSTRDPNRAPPLDPLVLSGPNALAGAALIRAGLYLENDTLTAAGRRAIDLVLTEAYRAGQGVGHVIAPNPERRIFLTAQADVALGLLEAYEALGEPRLLEAARDIVDFSLVNFKTDEHSALKDFVPLPPPVGLLSQARYPLAPNARMARAMIRLTLHGAGESYEEQAVDVLSSWAGDLAPFGVQATETALAIEESVRDPLTIEIHGPVDGEKTRALRAAALRSGWPWTLVRSGRARGKAEATFSWRGRESTADSPDALLDAVRTATGLDTR